MSTQNINLGLGNLVGKDLGDIFSNILLIDESKDVKETLADAVKILSLNTDYINTSKKTIKNVVNDFSEIYRNNIILFNSLLSKDYYSGSLNEMYENLCKHLLIISSLEDKDDKYSEDNYVLKGETCSKSKFIELYYSFMYLSKIDCGLEEISKIVTDYLTKNENNLDSSLTNYLNNKVKNFNVSGLHYIMKQEYKAQIINQILMNSIIVKEKYSKGSLTEISSIHASLETIADAYASVISKCNIVKALNNRDERVSDRIDYCVQPLSEINVEYLEKEGEYFKKLISLFDSKNSYNEW
jgi:hypothetical protein